MSDINNKELEIKKKQPQDRNDNQINFGELWFNILQKWHFFAIAIVIALIIAFFINKYTTPTYEARASLLIKEDAMTAQKLSGGMMTDVSVGFQNSVAIVRSRTTAKSAIKEMGMQCDYYQKVNFRNVDIYKDSPFEVILDPLQETQPTGFPIHVSLSSPTECKISYEEKKGVPLYNYVDDVLTRQRVSIAKRQDVKLTYGTWYEQDGMRFKIMLKDNWNSNIAKLNYSFVINDLDRVAIAYSNITTELFHKDASIIRMSYRNHNQRKATDFLNTLCKVYIDQTFEEKQYLNNATINFVNSQISTVKDSLSLAESKMENFQLSTNSVDLSKNASYLNSRVEEMQRKKAEEYMRQQYFVYLKDYLANANLEESVAIPSVMGISDGTLNSLVDQLSSAVVELKQAKEKRSDLNPKTKELQVKIQTLRSQIDGSMKTLKNVSELNLREIQRQQNELQVLIDRLPSQERNRINLDRQVAFNDAIYTYLYQKRADAEIAKSAARPDHKVIDNALTSVKVSPKSSMNYLLAIALGIIVPLAYIVFRFMTKDTVDSKDDIAKISSNPILGFIPEFPKEYNRMIVFDKPRSQITESYRSIRSNIKYVFNELKEQEGGKIILVTSSMPGEGKSLTSFNLASVFSITGEKTLLVEYDLRKPRLYKMLNLKNSIGISTYYIGQTSLDDSIQHTEFDNLDALCVGPVPPNPSEIIDSQKNKLLLKELRQKYDYIILDTPPVNLIADAQTLAKQADVSLFVVRLGVTSSSILELSLTEMEQRSGVKVEFICNGIQTVMQKYGYGKGYGYGYGGYGGYGYGKGYGRYGYSRYGYGKNGGYGYGYGSGDYLKEYSYGYFEDETSDLKRKKKISKTTKPSEESKS